MHADDVAGLTAWREVDPALASLWPATADPDSWDGVRVGADGRVTRLELSGQGLGGEVPAAVGRLVALEVLALDDNAVTALPPELGRLARLAELDVSGTHLETLPREMGSLVSLEELHACDAKLTSVPPELGRLAALRKLDLSVNALTTLPPDLHLASLVNLEWLNLRCNSLATVAVVDVPNLREIHLDHNKLVECDVRGASVRVLDLAHNALVRFPTLEALPALETLSLDGNADVETIPTGARSASALREVSLRGLHRLDDESRETLRALAERGDVEVHLQ